MVFCNKISSYTFSLKKLFSIVSWSALSVMTLMPISDTYADDHFNNGALNDATLNEIIVNADFRGSELQTTPASISIVDAQVINHRGNRHLDELLALVPNVNFAAGASRGRYFQIRGIGERGQFVAPINPSVGTYVDGIDFTGLGGAATLIDVEQVEILRGSQGTRFGANALAGVVNIKTPEPSAEGEGYIKAQAGTYNSYYRFQPGPMPNQFE